MNIAFKATNTTLTPSIKAFIADKLDIVSKFIKEEDKVRVELELSKKHHSGLIFRAEINIQPHGHYAEARGNDFYEALDLVLPKIKEQLTKQKDKKISLRRRRQKVK
ncbi:MAG TPA: ribosome-associated translation inhibitor RaiA [Candidatus Limnocylindria bacterium]|nr:ribosome-associated translation inhibitor RaiA [Candidatus Limnocylindria bacterium]